MALRRELQQTCYSKATLQKNLKNIIEMNNPTEQRGERLQTEVRQAMHVVMSVIDQVVDITWAWLWQLHGEAWVC